MLQDQYRALMQYSIPKECHVDKPPAKNTQDWHCVKVCIIGYNSIIEYIFISKYSIKYYLIFHFIIFYSVEHTILNDGKLVSSVPLREQKAKKAEKAVMRSVHIQRIPYFYGD